MRPSWLALFFGIPALVVSATHSIPDKHPTKESSSDLICHDTNCYSKHFVPTNEFQIIHDDQVVPLGLHYRLNVETGLKEAKINVASDSDDDHTGVVVIPNKDEEAAIIDSPKPIPRAPISPDGAIKPPLPSSAGEALAFSDSLEVLLKHSKYSTSEITHALLSLEDLVHEIYWGLQVSAPKYVSPLLTLVSNSPDPTIRSTAALVIGSALSNNPKALASATSDSSVKLIRTLLSSLERETDNNVKARILYALNQAIKSPVTRAEFLTGQGLQTLHQLFKNGDSEFMGKSAIVIEDNFLNEDMRSDAEVMKKQGGSTHFNPARDGIDERKFCSLFEDTLLKSTEKGIDNDVQEKIFSALSALKRKHHGHAGCKSTDDFLLWLDTQADLGGRLYGDVEEDGDQQLKLMAFDNRDLFP
ncbi:uncharacterized protein H6S33_002192 [Morchella sextelata]|jgi:nucleotide exchange factor SIL1|uniref:uncharacterized protein n=1 Tax=Morchella sextelata TaxID=1174677 RepID=UPI001D04F62F|nr:uncharacterized protein H6S33_002192 [Morchella sextelata]KAH0608140.1 hypothetical protein H6S33_002192 [Morchella sextelata]